MLLRAKGTSWHYDVVRDFKLPIWKKCITEIFWGVGFTYARSADSYSCISGYEYRYVSKEGANKIYSGETTPVTLDSDDHVRFSLFDSKNVEKSCDIDLSEIIHSYSILGDSVEIKMPQENFSMSIGCPYCHRRDSLPICEDSFACHYHSKKDDSVTIGTDSTWANFFTFNQYMTKQSSLHTDSVHVYGIIEFRWFLKRNELLVAVATFGLFCWCFASVMTM